MSVDACAAMVRAGDPDRFAASLAAPPRLRPRLWTLYALNLELARAPWAASEPMLAEMRLQWWIDRLTEIKAGIAPPLHDVLTPLAAAWPGGVPLMRRVAKARMRDCARNSFASAAEVVDYIDATAGNLIWQAALGMGAAPECEAPVRRRARGIGLAAWLRALPELQERGNGLAVFSEVLARELAETGLEALSGAPRLPRALAPVVFSAHARNTLSCASTDPDRFRISAPAVSEFRRRFALARLGLFGIY